MRIIRNSILPLPGFDGINLLGVLFVRPGVVVDEEMLRHERIHTRQMFETLVIGFYLWYLAEWVLRIAYMLSSLPFIPRGRRGAHLYAAYRNLLFEQEAYRHAHEADYLTKRQPYAWLRKL